MRLDRKVAVITGGASGIGEAIARAFATAGAEVHIADRNAEGAARVAGETGGFAHPGDLAEEEEVARVFSTIPRIDILVNSVGAAHVGTLVSTSPGDFDRLYRTNVRTYFLAMRASIGKMRDQGGGVILNLASIAGQAGLADRFAYSTTKGAVLAMTYSVARDCLPYKIRCNSISPARVHTPFVDGFVKKNYPGSEAEAYARLHSAQPIGRMGLPQEVAALALFLCSDEAAFVTGTDYPIDGGFLNLHG